MEKLTPSTARDARPGDLLRDHEVTGLQLRCRSTKKTWHLYYRTREGVERRPSIGSFPEISLSRARELAKDLKERIARGDDPSADWQEARDAPTVADLCARYLAEHAERNKSPAAAKEDRWMIEGQILPGLGHMRIIDVRTPDVERFLDNVLHRKYWKVGQFHKRKPKSPAPSQRNHVRTLLRTIFNKAVRPFRILPPDHINPVEDTSELELQKRRRKAEPAELARIAAEVRLLAATKPMHAAVLTALFATGARKSEVLRARVHEFDGASIVLRNHKTAAYIGPKTIHLPAAVCDVLNAQPRDRRPDDPLFGRIDTKKVWAKIRTAAGCPDLQLLDARRTFASYALSSGSANLDQIGNLFGHTDKQTTDGYAWLLDDTRRQIADDGAAAVMGVWNRRGD